MENYFFLSVQFNLDFGFEINSNPVHHLSLIYRLFLGTLETELRVMMDAVDELNQESIKFNKHQNLVLKQYQEKAR